MISIDLKAEFQHELRISRNEYEAMSFANNMLIENVEPLRQRLVYYPLFGQGSKMERSGSKPNASLRFRTATGT
jgi:hypothetical protein